MPRWEGQDRNSPRDSVRVFAVDLQRELAFQNSKFKTLARISAHGPCGGPFSRGIEKLHMKRMIQTTKWSTTWHGMMSLERFWTLEKSKRARPQGDRVHPQGVHSQMRREDSRWIDVEQGRLHQPEPLESFRGHGIQHAESGRVICFHASLGGIEDVDLVVRQTKAGRSQGGGG